MPAKNTVNGELQQQYPPRSVGHRMVVDVPIVQENHSLAELRAAIERHAGWFNTINYIYVLNDQRKLVGVLSVRDLFSNPPHAIAGKICKRDGLVTARPHSDQEHAALLALKHNIKAVPVVHADGVFIGELPNDAILAILYQEMHEDALRQAGIRHAGGVHSNILRLSIFDSLRHRLPWLIFGMFGGLLTARIIGLFESTLEQNLILASFIPLIVYMSDAVGTQMEAYIIRDLSIDRQLPFTRYFLRHLTVVAAMGALLGLCLFAFGMLFYRNLELSFTLGAAMFAAVLSSVCTGLVVPYLFNKFRCDPADASGPVATIVQDVVSIVIYFLIAAAML